MKSVAVAIGCFALLTAADLPAKANVADISIACTSVRVPDATATDFVDSTFEIRYTSDFSDTAVNSINSEWYQSVGTVGYASAFTLKSTDFGFTEIGFIEVEIPNPGDLNLNFLTDFFEVDRAVSGQTSGTIHIGDESQPVTAVWSRDAGQTTGSLTVSFPAFPSLLIGDLSFTHTFEIFQYKGQLTYTPATANGDIAASVDLSRVGGTFTGPFPLKLAADGTLERGAAKWTNAIPETFDVLGSFDIQDAELVLNRIPLRKQYAGSFFFVDGIPSTTGFEDEFDLWDVFINDPNDADLDGIADLGDSPGAVPPAAPEASLVWANNTLQLGIKAKAGTTISIQRRSSLALGDWEPPAQTFVLANDTETVVLPGPADSTSFWRVTAP